MKKDKKKSDSDGLRIQITGDTVEHLFMNAADAMADIMAPSRYGNVATSAEVHVVAADKDTALADFLNELLAQSNAERAAHLTESVTVEEGKKGVEIKAVMRQYLVPAFDENIKSVIQKEVHIEHKKGKWETDLVFDI